MLCRPLVLLVLASGACALAAEPFTLARLQELGAKAQTVHLPFTQEKHLAIFPEPVVSEGLIEISRPLAALRWEYTGRSLIILKDGRLRRWDDRGREQTGDDPSMTALGAQMRALLTGDFRVLDDLFVVTPAADGTPEIAMTPKKPELGRYIERITLRFRTDLSAPQELTITAPGDDLTVYRFGEPLLDHELPAARFAGP